jgi:1-acyl-sn-glycerol-3-phosphate acyltransferase
MKNAWLAVRSTFFWVVSGCFFFFTVSFLLILSIFCDQRKMDGVVRFFARTTMRLAGVRVSVKLAPGFDTKRTCFFVVNHVNLFDPFVLYSVVPQFIRGLELESHFKIPIYGVLMRRFGNVPVPDVRRPSDLKRMWRMTKEALDKGVSLIVFPEGTRTINGRIGPFEEGGFRMAQHLGYPVVPVSIVGSFEFNRKDKNWLHPSHIVVHIHDTIETAGLEKADIAGLKDRVHAIMAKPLDDYYEARDTKSATGTQR